MNKFRLIEVYVNKAMQKGIYRPGKGWIVDPSNTLFFNDEVEGIYAKLIQ